MINIRPATKLDQDRIQAIYWSAFPDSETQAVSALALNLLNVATEPKTLTLLAEVKGTVIGHITFSPVAIEQESWQGYILAPLAVDPEHHQQGAGSALITEGIKQLREQGINRIFVYGDPTFYGRFGFNTEAAANFLPAYQLQYPFGWQGLIVKDDGLADSTQTIHCVDALNQKALW